VKAFSSKAPTQVSEAGRTKKTITLYYAKPNLNESSARKKTKTTLGIILLPLKLLAKS
jgi:hypothetical protein